MSNFTNATIKATVIVTVTLKCEKTKCKIPAGGSKGILKQNFDHRCCRVGWNVKS